MSTDLLTVTGFGAVPQYFGGQTATLLEEYGGKGTYFVNGNNWDCIYSQRRANDLIKRYKAVHVIGVHGWSRESGSFSTNKSGTL